MQIGDSRTARRRRATHLGGYPHGQRGAQARERRPLVGTARRRRAAGRTPTSGVGRLSAGTPTFSISRTDAFRCASRSGADRRSAFPKPSPRFNADRLYAVSRPSRPPRCRPEVGVPQAVPAIQCRSAIRERRADAGRRISAGTPTGSVARRHGNADLWSAQPAEGGRREGPRLRGWVASRPGPRRSASAGRTPFAALRAAVPTGGRRSPSRPRDSMRSAIRAGRCASRSGADRRSALLGRRVGFRARRFQPDGTGALTRDAGRRPALLGRRRWGGFRAHARCRSETGAPWGGVGGAGFALTRDAGRRPALHGAASLGRVSRSRAMPVGDRRSWGSVAGGFRAHARCRSETGAPLSPRFNANFRARKKQMAANLWFAAGDFGGKCERGDSPLSQDGNDQSELAAARRRRAREFRLPARSAGRTPDGAPNPSRTTTESYSGSWPRPGSARP